MWEEIMGNIYILAFVILFLVLLVAFSVLKNDKEIREIEHKVDEEEQS